MTVTGAGFSDPQRTRNTMAAKALIALAIVAAIAVGLLLPTPGRQHKAQASQSQIETIDIKGS